MKVVNFIKKIFIKDHFHQKPLSSKTTFRENHGVDDLHRRSGSLAEMWCQFGVVPWALCPDPLLGAVYKYWAACHSSKSSRGGFCCSVRIGWSCKGDGSGIRLKCSASFRKTHCGCLPVFPCIDRGPLLLFRPFETSSGDALLLFGLWVLQLFRSNEFTSHLCWSVYRSHFGVKVIVSQMTFTSCWDSFKGAVGWRWAWENRGSHTVRSVQVPHTPGGTKYMLWVSGEPKKTAGPILRGAARSRTLQEGPGQPRSTAPWSHCQRHRAPWAPVCGAGRECQGRTRG